VIDLVRKAAGGAMPNIQKDVASCCEELSSFAFFVNTVSNLILL
jgi:hypothetical protein